MRVYTPSPQNTTDQTVAFVPQPGQWVQLRDRLSNYSYDQALLQCEGSNGHWVAWVPDHGLAMLKREQFLKLEE